MEISIPNEFGAHPVGHEEIVARHGRWFAAVNIALCEDGLYRFSTELLYSYGGHGGPVFISCPGFTTVAAAITVGTEKLLQQWPTLHLGEPQSVHDELKILWEQIEARLRQPSLF